MSLSQLPLFQLVQHDGPHVLLRSPEGHAAHVFVLEPDVVRLLVLPDGRLRAPRTWAIAPGASDVPAAGRDRFDLSGFSLPSYSLEEDPDELRIVTPQIRLTVRKNGLRCRWEVLRRGRFEPAAADRPTQAYNFGFWDSRTYHYLQRSEDEMYFGLGERSGDLDRAGQRFRLCNQDAMGYSARTSDPLYKHIPFYITWHRQTGAACGLFYDTLSDCTFDFGKEIDNYHGPYRSFVAEHGDLDLYFIAGEDLAPIVRRYTWLTGRPAFMPRWSLGYSGSTMAYTDAPDAQVRMEEFLDRCAAHDILCDSFHLSSGYTTIGRKRYVFNWDRSKFPDPSALVARYRAHGVRLCANVKPCLLRDHPLFAKAAAEGLLVTDGKSESGVPLLVQFWDELGAYLDFTNPRTQVFWKEQVTTSLLRHGIAATWNDNNEYEIWSPEARLCSDATPQEAIAVKPLQPLLMMRASREAQQQFAPEMRPLVVSRSGAAGMQRYAQTWSGDNHTSWETLRYNLRMGLGLALSGVSNSGHDVGGFAGPAPTKELFLRWVQCGVFMPRFSIHSWNSDGSVSEPWMYPELTDEVRALIRLRYCLIPYLYELMFRAHTRYEPVTRPAFYDFPDDVRCYEACDEAMLGPSLLLAPVVEPGRLERTVYLPRGSGWYCLFTGMYSEGGETVTLPAPWSHPVVLVREGSVLPLNLAAQHFARPAFAPGFAIFPPHGCGTIRDEFFDDDGETEAYRGGRCGTWRIEVSAFENELQIRIDRGGQVPPPHTEVTLLLPVGEARRVSVTGGDVQRDLHADGLPMPHRGVRVRLWAETESGCEETSTRA